VVFFSLSWRVTEVDHYPLFPNPYRLAVNDHHASWFTQYKFWS